MKMTTIILAVLLTLTIVGRSQDRPFPGLRHLAVDSVYGASVNYRPQGSVLLMHRYVNEADIDYVDILLARLDPSRNDTFLVQYDQGPSADPEFTVYRKEPDTLSRIGSINGLELTIPGTGYLYVSGHTDNMFTTRRKFRVTSTEIREIAQPFLYVGLESTTLQQVSLFADTTLISVVAVLPKGSSVDVLLNQGDFYLLKTPFGLLGWTEIPATQAATVIKGLFYAGD